MLRSYRCCFWGQNFRDNSRESYLRNSLDLDHSMPGRKSQQTVIDPLAREPTMIRLEGHEAGPTWLQARRASNPRSSRSCRPSIDSGFLRTTYSTVLAKLSRRSQSALLLASGLFAGGVDPRVDYTSGSFEKEPYQTVIRD